MCSPPDPPRRRSLSARFALLQMAGLAATNHLLTVAVPRLLPCLSSSRIHDDLRLFGEAAATDLARAAVTLAIVPGVLEELLFRGLLFAGLERLAGWRWAVIGSALAFGAVHLDPQLSTIAALLGLQLGVVRAIGGIGLAIASHVANNLLVLLLRAHAETGAGGLPDLDTVPPGASLLLALALALPTWAALVQAVRSPRVPERRGLQRIPDPVESPRE